MCNKTRCHINIGEYVRFMSEAEPKKNEWKTEMMMKIEKEKMLTAHTFFSLGFTIAVEMTSKLLFF